MIAERIMEEQDRINHFSEMLDEQTNNELKKILGDKINFKWERNENTFKLIVTKHLNVDILKKIEEETGCTLKEYQHDCAIFKYDKRGEKFL